MKHIISRNGRYYFNRRVPDSLQEHDPRETVRIALKTDSKEKAVRDAVILNGQLEAYWRSLVQLGLIHNDRQFKAAVRTARLMGFCYMPVSDIAASDLPSIRERIAAVSATRNPEEVASLLGGVPVPEIKLSSLLDKFWAYSKERTLNKSTDQLRKWKNPRIRAVNNFIALVGDKSISDIRREDIVLFRDWWGVRIQQENVNLASANKDFIHLKNILETISDNLLLEIDIPRLFKKIMFKSRFEQTRLPFTTNQILTLFGSDKLNKMGDEAKWLLFASAETGARPSEIVGLLPEDIRLNAEVPHIVITDRKERPLKTPHSAREIPLVGYALEAFQHMPNGFPRYRDKPDNLTNAVNKFLRQNKLLPSGRHSVYSFRHSFQDRILSVNAPDRVQAELMGHRFVRPKYGEGATLAQKKEWLDKVVLKK